MNDLRARELFAPDIARGKIANAASKLGSVGVGNADHIPGEEIALAAYDPRG